LKGNIKDLGVSDTPIAKITRNPLQPRVVFDKSKLKELADNIRHNGLLQPIVLRLLQDQYIIIAGERRYRAHLLNNAKTIKAKVIECDDQTAYELTLLENIQRENLSLLEEARGYKHLKDQYKYKLKELSKVTSKSISNISNIMSILDEDLRIQKYVDDGTLTLAAFVWIKKLPNQKEKVALLEKLRNEEVKRTKVREYVERVCEAYAVATRLGLRPEDVLKSLRAGKAGRFDIKQNIVPPDFKFYFIVDFVINRDDIPFLPSKNILASAYSLMYDKGASKRMSLVLMEKKQLDSIFMDSGVMPAAKRKDWKFFDNIDGLIDLYEMIKPDICTSMDVPMYPFVYESWDIPKEQMLDITIENAKKFLEWKPSFETVKVFPIQGTTKEEYLESLQRLQEIGVFKEQNVAIAFGGMATTSSGRQQSIVSYVLSSDTYKNNKKCFKFVHCFGVGHPDRIIELYKLGVTSFDSLSVCLLSNVGWYWLRDGRYARHIIHESPLSRKVRLYFNMASFWGQMVNHFSKYRGIPFKDEQEKVKLKTLENLEDVFGKIQES
jgi:ParB family chromosome partitioning protein